MDNPAADIRPVNVCSLLGYRWLLPSALAIFLIAISFQNYLLFHILAEIFTIIVAILAAVVIWHTYPFSSNHYLMYLGGGYLWVALLDVAHTLTYKGMTIFPIVSANISTQFWVSARCFEAFLLVSAPLFLTQKSSRILLAGLFGAVTIVLYGGIMSGNFPDAFIEGKVKES